jgi:MoxR-like ATPase
MYKVQQYNDVIGRQDADTQKRYSMIERLSKGFTVHNDTARQMDDLLAEQLSMQAHGEAPAAPKPKSSGNGNPRPKPQPQPSSDLVAKFDSLFDALKEGVGKPIGKEELKAALYETLETVKISMGHLDSGVQKMLYESSANVVIKYDLPAPAKPIPFRKPEIGAFQQIVDDIVTGNNVMLVGGAGTGKTYLAENLVAKSALGRPHLTINCSQWTSPTEIVGGQTMDGYVEGKLIEAWQNGYVLILDELPKIDPNTAGLLNDALAKTKTPNAVIFNSRRESFTKHDDFAVIATGNVYPDKESMAYGANNKQDLSLLDRFAGSVHIIEKNPAIEREIVRNDMVWSICDKLRDAITELKYEAQVSLRLMMNCRDAYNLEMARVKDNGKNGVTADQGKTFKSTIDSYLSTFTEVQRNNLKGKIRYSERFERHAYRRLDTTKIVN